MDFKFQEHFTSGSLNESDLAFFYYDIGLDHMQGLPVVYDWDKVVEEFKEQLNIDSCTDKEISDELVQNQIRFTVANQKNLDNNSKSAAFFRHLRNAFAHYHIVREGENYILTDRDRDKTKKLTMRGMVNAELLKNFCFKFFDVREKILNDMEDANNQTF